MTTISEDLANTPKPKPVLRLANWADVVIQGGQVVLQDTDWDQYIRFREYFARRGFGRVSYCDGTLEIMSLSLLHERVSRMLTLIIFAWAEFKGLSIDCIGSATIGDREKDAGKQPDESFRLYDNEEDENPDLAIEVVVSSEAIDKLSFYARFGIREVWIWKDDKIAVHVLKKDGSGYRKARKSSSFPELDMKTVEQCTSCQQTSEGLAKFKKSLKK